MIIAIDQMGGLLRSAPARRCTGLERKRSEARSEWMYLRPAVGHQPYVHHDKGCALRSGQNQRNANSVPDETPSLVLDASANSPRGSNTANLISLKA